MGERKFTTVTRTVGRLQFTFKTEVGPGFTDTEVLICGACFCWISKADIPAFITQIEQTVNAFEI